MSDLPVVVQLDARGHRDVQALLPWYAAQTLESVDRERVEAHLADCAHCQAELAFERRLHAALHTGPDASNAGDDAIERGLARLGPRLDAGSAPPDLRRRLGRAVQRLRDIALRGAGAPHAALATALALVAVLGSALVLLPALGDRYRALGTPGAAGQGTLIVMFRPGASEAEMRQALRDSNARIADGPTAAGAYVLSVPAGSQAAALAVLRARPAVALAEPLAATTAP